MIIASAGSRKIGNIACAPNDIATPAQAGIQSSRVYPLAQARRFSWSRELICDIRIGPRENSPTSAFRVSPRR